MASRISWSVPVTVNDVLDRHVKLDLQCLDRLYPHGYLGRLQVSGQLVQFLKHRGYPIPSAACLQLIGDAFRRRVASFADANHIPVAPLKAAYRAHHRRAADAARRPGCPGRRVLGCSVCWRVGAGGYPQGLAAGVLAKLWMRVSKP